MDSATCMILATNRSALSEEAYAFLSQRWMKRLRSGGCRAVVVLDGWQLPGLVGYDALI